MDHAVSVFLFCTYLCHFFCCPGSYIYIETSFPRGRGDVAIIQSMAYGITEQTCEYGFWYHMYGGTVGTLEVLVTVTGASLNSSVSIWKLSGDQGNSWKYAKAKIPPVFVGKSVQASDLMLLLQSEPLFLLMASSTSK